MSETTERFEIPGVVISDCMLRRPASGVARRLYLLLHGYEQSGAYFFRKCAGTIAAADPEALIVAPNGIFPLPRKEGDRYTVGFSWYFYDFSSDEYFIGMEPAVVFLQGLVARLEARELPVTLIGFSQGGYLAPFAAQAIPAVDRVIGIGCRFLEREVEGELRFRLDAIHGARDELVPWQPTRRSFDAFQARGAKGEFILLPETGHRMDEAAKDALRRLLSPPAG
ncbi:MAG: hypothetical protein NDJ89_04995 [Oligoflexia bacterium]|nr:hypothetical protein [Oligoflexia bacterium]